MNEEEKADLERFNWLVENIQEELFNKKGNDLFYDCRLIFKLPTMISFTCIGTPVSFREAIDLKMGKELNEEV